ncbi:hypothetical protein JZX76_02730 [Haloarcula hispanica]|uniref:TATA-box-binding protein n=1 Tax=Haloarcula hispanica TaxID=51589 RepID=A0A482T4C3_HALHI|nr:hypothetical protein [Haloarcula hispanica]MCJ0618476.1 hypothetical protein [Haloarcula hispanica]RYJ09072.1 hypothetical protein ELS20_02750 [Haloarcula hispanica]
MTVPGLIYRPEEHNCVLLIFGSGKVVITGCKDLDTAQSALDDLERTLSAVRRNPVIQYVGCFSHPGLLFGFGYKQLLEPGTRNIPQPLFRPSKFPISAFQSP